MNTVDADRGTLAGKQMVAELLWAHGPLRRDIEVLTQGMEFLETAPEDPKHVLKDLEGLTVADFGWQLRTRCNVYCQGLTLHHSLEDQLMFPVLEREFDGIVAVTARLKSDHERVSALVAEVLAAVRALGKDPHSITQAIEKIDILKTELIAHLDFEEESVFPYFLKMERNWHLG